MPAVSGGVSRSNDGGHERPDREPADQERGQREPGQRKPGQREPGQREPGQREPGQRLPGQREPGDRGDADDGARSDGGSGASHDEEKPSGPSAADAGITGSDALTYEAARDGLADIVRALEAGGLPLEESLRLWERGERLAGECERWLAGARERLDRVVGPTRPSRPGAD